MDWIHRPDDQSCCGDDPGAVKPGETVARLLHSRIVEPHGEPIKRSELFPPPKGFTNDCGDADGVSVVRNATLTDDQVRAMSEALAAMRPGRTPEGALVALVDDLRSIVHDATSGQVVFIYDDPIRNIPNHADDPFHAVIRASDTIPRPDQDDIRDKVRTAFSGRIVA